MDYPVMLSEAWRMYRRARRQRHSGFKRWPGSSWQVCESIVQANWTGKYFTTSLGNYRQFYSRDFGMCAEALVGLDHKQKVIETLHFALSTFRRAGRITTHITPYGRPLDFPSYTPESLAYVLKAMTLVKDRELQEFRPFIEAEAKKAFRCTERDTGLIRRDRNFSSMKDHAKRESPCYLNCMLSMISDSLDRLRWENPFKHYNYGSIIKQNFWNGSYFMDDLSGREHVAGDANVFPFWTKANTSKAMFAKSFDAMKEAKLDDPLPLRYTAEPVKGQYLFLPQLLMPNWEGNTVWLHLGACFMEVINRFKRPELKEYMGRYAKMIEVYRTFPEVLNPDGSPYRLPWYYCDEGMLWSSMILRMT